MGIASAVSGGLGVGMGIYQTIQGAKQKREAQNALENYQRQELENVYDNTAVSTLGADRQIENQARLASGQIASLQGAGARGMIGGFGRVEAGNQNVNQQIAADLDQQQKQIDFARAGDQANIRSMQENRENADIGALSSQYMAGKQDQNTGLGNIVMGAGMMGSAIGGMGGGAGVQNPTVSPIGNNLQPAGMVNPSQISVFNPTNALRYPQFNQGGLGMFAQPRMPQVGYYNQSN
jgi:hypothetical protein